MGHSSTSYGFSQTKQETIHYQGYHVTPCCYMSWLHRTAQCFLILTANFESMELRERENRSMILLAVTLLVHRLCFIIQSQQLWKCSSQRGRRLEVMHVDTASRVVGLYPNLWVEGRVEQRWLDPAMQKNQGGGRTARQLCLHLGESRLPVPLSLCKSRAGSCSQPTYGLTCHIAACHSQQWNSLCSRVIHTEGQKCQNQELHIYLNVLLRLNS